MNKNSDKFVLISGGTNGIGKAAALELTRQGFNTCIIGKSLDRCRSTADEILNLTGNKIEWINSDLSTIEGIKQAANLYIERHERLTILVNNAGAHFKQRIITKDGYEKTFALNHLNYFLLTKLLLNTLQSSAPARIINVSSIAHYGVRFLDFNNLQGEITYNGLNAYFKSKLCNILFSKELSRRVNPKEVIVNAMNPGYVSTGFSKNNKGVFRSMVIIGDSLIARRPKKGAETIIYMATSEEIRSITGKYFFNCAETRSSKLSQNKEVAKKLWEISNSLTQI